MPIQQLPLMKGVGKDFRNADYIDYLPVNMLATPKEILNSSGYLRSFPGIAKRSDVKGIATVLILTVDIFSASMIAQNFTLRL